jgi:hypothetical protein
MDDLREALDRLGAQRRRVLIHAALEGRSRADAEGDTAMGDVWQALARKTHHVERAEAARLAALDPDHEHWRAILTGDHDDGDPSSPPDEPADDG